MMVASKRRKQNPNKTARVRRKRVLVGQSDKPEALEDVGEVKEVEEVKECLGKLEDAVTRAHV